MTSVSKNSLRKTTKPTRRRTSSTYQRRRRIHARACKAKTKRSTCSKVSQKLEALKNLIPANNGETVKAEQLFQETADYIVLLKTQVFVLQRLIQFYGSTAQQEEDNVAVVS